MKKLGMLRALAAAFCLLLPAMQTYAAEKGAWDRSEDGKDWIYYYSPGEPAENEWIEEDGREYYVDSKGRMKTGWVTDKKNGKKYYMGEDGAKCFNAFTPDGHYVGEEGTILEAFDAYRKELKKPLNTLIKSKEYKGLETNLLPGFALIDLNGDGYRDLVVFDHALNPQRLLLASIWDEEEEKLQTTAEADADGGGETSWLSYNPETQSMWLVIASGNGWDRDYFLMDENGLHLENVWHFAMETDDWGDPDYYVNGDRITGEEWNDALKQADRSAGAALESVLLPLTEENVLKTVDSAPSQEEMPLWQL